MICSKSIFLRPLALVPAVLAGICANVHAEGNIDYSSQVQYNVGIDYDVESSVISAGVSDSNWEYIPQDKADTVEEYEQTLAEFSENAWDFIPDWLPSDLRNSTNSDAYSSKLTEGEPVGLEGATNSLSTGVLSFRDADPASVAGGRVLNYDVNDLSKAQFGAAGVSSVGISSAFIQPIQGQEMQPLFAGLPSNPNRQGVAFFYNAVPRLAAGLVSSLNRLRQNHGWLRIFIHAVVSGFLLLQLSLMLRSVGRQMWDVMVYAVTGQDFQKHDRGQ